MYVDGEVQTSRNFQRAKVSSKTRAVPAGRFQRRVNYTTPREKRGERKKRESGRAAHIKRELNVEISVSPQPARDNGGGPARRIFFPPPRFTASLWT